MKTIFLLSFFVFQTILLNAQELLCNVVVNDQQVQTQERQIFREMEKAIANFMNNTEWTKDKFSQEERISCNILITLLSSSNVTSGKYVANMQLKTERPIFGTDYLSPVINYLDSKFSFEYNLSQPLIFSENAYTTELTSLLAYYAYIILALDYDTFSPKGGNPYLERALNILNNSQQAGGQGWSSFGDTRDRYWLLDNLNSPQFADFRQALYEYHRLGMDTFDQDNEAARKVILESLKKMRKVKETVPQTVTMAAFFVAKVNEILNIFSRASLQERTTAVEQLVILDPINADNYRKLTKQ
jgi:hypothetical protein